MKAEWCGTLTEQHRFRVQWKSSSERRAEGISDKCGNCSGLDQKHGAHCKTHNFGTRVGAVCSNFKQRTPEDI